MKFLIAGLGSIGRRHLRNLLALGERDIVLYRTGKSTLPDAELADFPTETRMEAALAHHPDAVIVANPTALHLDVAIPAALAGCHILLEKPVSHSMDRLDELSVAVQRGGGQVLVGFQYRYHPGLMKIKSLLDEGAIGRVLSARSHWGEYLPGWHPWEDYRQGYAARADLGGGVVLTLCHPLDYLRWLLGDVKNLWAFTSHLSDLELTVEDTAEIGLQFASGVLSSLHLDYFQQPLAHTLSLTGAQGMIRWDNQDGITQLFRAGSQSWEQFPPAPGFERNWLFMDQMRHFLEVTSGTATPRCTLQDGIQALRLVLAVHQSSSQSVQVRFYE